MYFDFNEKSSFLLIFFLHGLVFSALIFSKGLQNDDKSSYWLGAFTLLCSLYIAPFMFGYAGWYGNKTYRDILFFIPFQQLFLLPPVLFYYFKSLLDKSFLFSKKDYIHFFPAILYLIYSLIIFVTDKIILNEYYFYADGKDKDLSSWYQIGGFLSLAFYLIVSLRLYQDYKNIIYNTLSFADSFLFKWAKRFLIAFLMLLAIRSLFFIFNPEWGEFGKKFWYYLCFSLLFYFISVSGYVNSIRTLTSFNELNNNSEDKLSDQILEKENSNQNDDDESKMQHLNSWKQKIEKLMLEDKMYENPELIISDLCVDMETHSKKISEIINQGFKLNFNDFVNYHRTLAVIKRLENGDHNRVTLLSIAFDCGFNSKSTFNRAFKRHTSTTPKEYIENKFQK